MVGVPPSNYEEVLLTSPWWSTFYIGRNFGFPAERAAQLAAQGITSIGALWSTDHNRFWTWEELYTRYQLSATERRRVLAIHSAIPRPWVHMLLNGRYQTQPGEFIGFFSHPDALQPEVIICTEEFFTPALEPGLSTFSLPPGKLSYSVGARSFLLKERILPLRDDQPELLRGWMPRTRIIQLTSGSAKRKREFLFSAGRYIRWAGKGLLPSYSAKLGRSLLHDRTQLSRPIGTKWRGILPDQFQPNWRKVWMPCRPRKDAAFRWSLYHGAIAVNVWRNRINPRIPVTCTCCTHGALETLLHCFFECPQAQHAWTYALTLLYRSRQIAMDNFAAWPAFTFQQCIFGSPVTLFLNSSSQLNKSGLFFEGLISGIAGLPVTINALLGNHGLGSSWRLPCGMVSSTLLNLIG